MPFALLSRGEFDVTQRLGCIGCPLQSDNGVADFLQYPKMLRQLIRAGKVWWNKERETPLASVEKFGDIYALMAHSLFFDDYDSFQAANTSMFGKEDWKQRLEDFLRLNYNYGNTKDKRLIGRRLGASNIEQVRLW